VQDASLGSQRASSLSYTPGGAKIAALVVVMASIVLYILVFKVTVFPSTPEATSLMNPTHDNDSPGGHGSATIDQAMPASLEDPTYIEPRVISGPGEATINQSSLATSRGPTYSDPRATGQSSIPEHYRDCSEIPLDSAYDEPPVSETGLVPSEQASFDYSMAAGPPQGGGSGMAAVSQVRLVATADSVNVETPRVTSPVAADAPAAGQARPPQAESPIASHRLTRFSGALWHWHRVGLDLSSLRRANRVISACCVTL
jgi:hypothetical protein